VGGSSTRRQSAIRGGCFQNLEIRENEAEGLEADGDQSNLCRREFHKKAAKVRAIYSTHGA